MALPLCFPPQDVQERDMAADFERRQRAELEKNMEEELRQMMAADAGKQTMQSAAPLLTKDSASMQQSIPTLRTGSTTLDLDAIIAGAGGSARGPRDALDLEVRRQPSARGRGALGESLTGASKFIFPDGQTAPATSAPPSARLEPLDELPTVASPFAAKRTVELNIPSSLQASMGGGDSLGVEKLYMENKLRLNYLNDLSANPDAGSTDQLDQLLVDFLNKQVGERDASSASGAKFGNNLAGGAGASLGGTLKADSRLIGASGRPFNL